ncbi:YtxH domain-containing protein [Lacisediminihabitans profunda]|uniref:YtxH domain-containing protein n=1 Tax=Lacisediminihabitans profunda TaxID=2594790 RepID=A0A5C8UM13_9MICO|nr:YtxH domain-containing protein [Lacisediminihabitans profunda]TXN29392.1 YtxH domain-containing protein [Lacisediminihabitans profunda]
MRGKLLFLVGLAAGYVLGTRAGRERYEQIKRAANRLWNDPRVQRQVKQAEDFAKDKAPEVADFLAEGAKKVVSQVSGRPATAKAPKSRPAAAKKSPATSTATSTDTAK